MMFGKEGQGAETSIQQTVYDFWDGSSEAPDKRRVRDAVPDPELEVMTWRNGSCSFPDALFNKFTPGTKSHSGLQDLKDRALAGLPEDLRVPASLAPATASNPGASLPPLRAGGKPDFSIEGGKRPRDWTQEVDLAIINARDFSEPRYMKAGFKSKLIVGKHENILQTFNRAVVLWWEVNS